jgi:aldose sugar dehydrogenase
MSLILFVTVSLVSLGPLYVGFGQEEEEEANIPKLRDSTLKMELVASGIESPTSMAFLGPNDVLVLEKDKGTVQRIVSGEISEEPILDVNVNAEDERGLLGIAVSKNSSTERTYVFLFYTEAEGTEDGGEPIANRLYRYELVDGELANPTLLLDLPYLPGPAHNGGVVTMGPDNNVYVAVGELTPTNYAEGDYKFLSQNYENGDEPDGRGGILRVTQDGQIVDGKGILGDEHPLDLYYAYGIRNSFGLDFDPLTGKLWDTENGGNDEINLVQPGFNSGWEEVSGKASLQEDFEENDLVDFDGKGKYSDPEFTWEPKSDFRIAPTSIAFLDSNKFGEQYENDIFVGDVRGNVYHFNLDQDRTTLLLDGPLADEVANDVSEVEDLIFAKFPGIITDLEVGPDGYLYALLYDRGELFRIVPSSQ